MAKDMPCGDHTHWKLMQMEYSRGCSMVKEDATPRRQMNGWHTWRIASFIARSPRRTDLGLECSLLMGICKSMVKAEV